MKNKMSQEQFNQILVALESDKNQNLAHMGVRLVANNDLNLDYLSEIPNHYKESLCRKVLRYVAKTALKGTFELDGLALGTFCAMKYGKAVSFGEATKFSFWSNRLNQKVNVEICPDDLSFSSEVARFYDENHKLLMEVEIWTGCHWTLSYGRMDLVNYFDDIRNSLL